jgi:hypothetical protein
MMKNTVKIIALVVLLAAVTGGLMMLKSAGGCAFQPAAGKKFRPLVEGIKDVNVVVHVRPDAYEKLLACYEEKKDKCEEKQYVFDSFSGGKVARTAQEFDGEYPGALKISPVAIMVKEQLDRSIREALMGTSCKAPEAKILTQHLYNVTPDGLQEQAKQIDDKNTLTVFVNIINFDEQAQRHVQVGLDFYRPGQGFDAANGFETRPQLTAPVPFSFGTGETAKSVFDFVGQSLKNLVAPVGG